MLNARRSSECFIWLALTPLGCAPSLDLLGKVPSSGPAGDAGGDASGPGAAFFPPTLVPAISDPNADDEDPTFTGDLRELYFSSDRAGVSDIWVSHRASPPIPGVRPRWSSSSAPAASIARRRFRSTAVDLVHHRSRAVSRPDLALHASNTAVGLGGASAGIRAREPELRLRALDRCRRDHDVLFIAAPERQHRDRYLPSTRGSVSSLGHAGARARARHHRRRGRSLRRAGRPGGVLHADADGQSGTSIGRCAARPTRSFSPALAAHRTSIRPRASRTRPCRSISCT